MHDPEKSDSGIVATKPTNKAGRPAAEPVEPRPGTKGNADQQSTHRTQSRGRVTQALDRVRKTARQRKPDCALTSNTRGRSRMPELGPSGSGAARLAAIPAGESPANTRSPVHVVVISSGRAGDQSAGSLEVKALWGREIGSIRQRRASNLAGRNVSKPGSLERRAPREADCGNFGSAEPLRSRRRPCSASETWTITMTKLP